MKRVNRANFKYGKKGKKLSIAGNGKGQRASGKVYRFDHNGKLVRDRGY